MPRKIKFKIDVKSFTNYIATILFSTVIFASILIALPLTEQYLNNLSYNINSKDSQYWAKEYLLTLESNDKQDAEKVRNILFRRLNKFGVEEVSTYGEYTEDIKQIRIEIQTSKTLENVEELIRNPFQIQMVTRKDDVDFNNEEDPYAYLLASNYNATEWERKDFRNIFLTELKDSSGEDSYFAIFKPWLTNRGGFENFLIQHADEYIGVNIDGFVTPYYVQAGNTDTFAVQLSTKDLEQIEVTNILYNSGIMPTSYNLESEIEIDVIGKELSYIWTSVGIVVATIATYAYLFFFKNSSPEILITSLVTTILITAFYITILKLWAIPTDTFILAIDAILIALLTRVLIDNKDSKIYISGLLGSFSIIMMFFGIGYTKILGKEILLLTAVILIMIPFSEMYINMVKKVLKK